MASRSLNKIMIIGNLTRDPELKYTPSGTAVCTFGVATNRSWTTNEGQTREEVQYHRIVAWQKLAELCGKLLTKGRKVFLEGRMTYRSFVGRDGQQRSIAEIVLDDFIVFGDGRRPIEAGEENEAKEDKSSATVENTTEGSNPVEEELAPTEQTSKESSKKTKKTDASEDVNPDDIPF